MYNCLLLLFRRMAACNDGNVISFFFFSLIGFLLEMQVIVFDIKIDY